MFWLFWAIVSLRDVFAVESCSCAWLIESLADAMVAAVGPAWSRSRRAWAAARFAWATWSWTWRDEVVDGREDLARRHLVADGDVHRGDRPGGPEVELVDGRRRDRAGDAHARDDGPGRRLGGHERCGRGLPERIDDPDGAGGDRGENDEEDRATVASVAAAARATGDSWSKPKSSTQLGVESDGSRDTVILRALLWARQPSGALREKTLRTSGRRVRRSGRAGAG